MLAVVLGSRQGDARALMVEGVMQTVSGRVLVMRESGGAERQYFFVNWEDACLLPRRTLPIQISAIEGSA